MKKYLFLLATALMLFASCEGPAGRDGRDGLDGEGMNWFVGNYTINENRWELVGKIDELNSYYRAEIKIPELSNFVYENGNVFCYMYQNIDGIEVQTLLPYTIPLGEYNNGDYLWTETFAFDFTPGSIMVYFNPSDFMTNNRPATTEFRVVLNW